MFITCTSSFYHVKLFFFIVMIELKEIKLNQFIKININDDVNNCEEEEDDIQYNTYTKYTCI